MRKTLLADQSVSTGKKKRDQKESVRDDRSGVQCIFVSLHSPAVSKIF